MAKKTAPLMPATDELLQQFGERLRLARLRRNLTAKQVCERAGMTPMTLRSLERGGSGVTIGAYLAVMQCLGIEGDLQLLGQADSVGRFLQDSRLPVARVHSKHTRQKANQAQAEKAHGALGPNFAEMARIAFGPDGKNVAVDEEFASSDSLANLIAATLAKKDR